MYESHLNVLPLYASVLPAGYWPVLYQCGSPGGYKTKQETLKLKCYKALYLYHFKRHNFMCHCKGQLSARPIDYTATDTTRSTPVSPGCWKSYGVCVSGDSCCLVIKNRCDRVWVTARVSLLGHSCRDRPLQSNCFYWPGNMDQMEKCIGASFIIFHGSINPLKLM